jgi:hypothetical protein
LFCFQRQVRPENDTQSKHHAHAICAGSFSPAARRFPSILEHRAGKQSFVAATRPEIADLSMIGHLATKTGYDLLPGKRLRCCV